MKKDITYTNRENLPISVLPYLIDTDYDLDKDEVENTVSATTLLKPTRQIILESRIEKASLDVTALIASSMGRAVHNAIEKAWNDKDKLVPQLPLPAGLKRKLLESTTISMEQRASKQVGKWTVSGKYDFVMNGSLEDFKVTKTYNYTNERQHKKYALQGSIYRWLNQDVITNDIMNITFFFTDFSPARAGTSSYPPSAVVSKPFSLMSVEDTERFVKNKVKEVEIHWDKPESQLPPCPEEDLWRSPDTYKYYANPDAKRATKNFTNEAEANAHCISKGKGVVRKVPGTVSACKYCNVFDLCTQKDDLIKSGELIL